jgi:hypothetical protein
MELSSREGAEESNDGSLSEHVDFGLRLSLGYYC